MCAHACACVRMYRVYICFHFVDNFVDTDNQILS